MTNLKLTTAAELAATSHWVVLGMTMFASATRTPFVYIEPLAPWHPPLSNLFRPAWYMIEKFAFAFSARDGTAFHVVELESVTTKTG